MESALALEKASPDFEAVLRERPLRLASTCVRFRDALEADRASTPTERDDSRPEKDDEVNHSKQTLSRVVCAFTGFLCRAILPTNAEEWKTLLRGAAKSPCRKGGDPSAASCRLASLQSLIVLCLSDAEAFAESLQRVLASASDSPALSLSLLASAALAVLRVPPSEGGSHSLLALPQRAFTRAEVSVAALELQREFLRSWRRARPTAAASADARLAAACLSTFWLWTLTSPCGGVRRSARAIFRDFCRDGDVGGSAASSALSAEALQRDSVEESLEVMTLCGVVSEDWKQDKPLALEVGPSPRRSSRRVRGPVERGSWLLLRQVLQAIRAGGASAAAFFDQAVAQAETPEAALLPFPKPQQLPLHEASARFLVGALLLLPANCKADVASLCALWRPETIAELLLPLATSAALQALARTDGASRRRAGDAGKLALVEVFLQALSHLGTSADADAVAKATASESLPETHAFADRFFAEMAAPLVEAFSRMNPSAPSGEEDFEGIGRSSARLDARAPQTEELEKTAGGFDFFWVQLFGQVLRATQQLGATPRQGVVDALSSFLFKSCEAAARHPQLAAALRSAASERSWKGLGFSEAEQVASFIKRQKDHASDEALALRRDAISAELLRLQLLHFQTSAAPGEAAQIESLLQGHRSLLRELSAALQRLTGAASALRLAGETEGPTEGAPEGDAVWLRRGIAELFGCCASVCAALRVSLIRGEVPERFGDVLKEFADLLVQRCREVALNPSLVSEQVCNNALRCWMGLAAQTELLPKGETKTLGVLQTIMRRESLAFVQRCSEKDPLLMTRNASALAALCSCASAVAGAALPRDGAGRRNFLKEAGAAASSSLAAWLFAPEVAESARGGRVAAEVGEAAKTQLPQRRASALRQLETQPLAVLEALGGEAMVGCVCSILLQWECAVFLKRRLSAPAGGAVSRQLTQERQQGLQRAEEPLQELQREEDGFIAEFRETAWTSRRQMLQRLEETLTQVERRRGYASALACLVDVADLALLFLLQAVALKREALTGEEAAVAAALKEAETFGGALRTAEKSRLQSDLLPALQCTYTPTHRLWTQLLRTGRRLSREASEARESPFQTDTRAAADLAATASTRVSVSCVVLMASVLKRLGAPVLIPQDCREGQAGETDAAQLRAAGFLARRLLALKVSAKSLPRTHTAQV